ncbi:hypothetical protein CEXT_684291 [Caerostris extrusa]|uniref:Uncharacterized protein n=1 Tax=Caerostris extrusa TaxID=172846 RepID=A0AAV4XDI3_CAEEX|nr:hypothetical protein CEXT_684291 [Caerostris extrusa]
MKSLLVNFWGQFQNRKNFDVHTEKMGFFVRRMEYFCSGKIGFLSAKGYSFQRKTENMLYAYEQKALKRRCHGNASFSCLILGSVFHTASVFTVTLPKHAGELRSHRFYFIYKLKMSQTPPREYK